MYYDKELAESVAAWFPKYLRHTKGKWAGQPFNLLPWQGDEIIKPLFGTLREDGKRQYKTVYVEIPKKQGKSELAAGVGLRLLFADNEPMAEIYGAAADRDQASIVYEVAAKMVEMEPRLASRCKVLHSTKRIIHNNGSFYRVLSADAYTKHGLNTHGVIFDELHAQPNRELWDVLTEGAGDAREQPVIFAITTAGYDRNSVCWEVHEYARKVKEKIIVDPTFLPVIYSLPEDADWQNEENWKEVNPSIGITTKLSTMRADFEKIKYIPAKQNSFRRLRLNQWTSQSEKWLDMHAWDACVAAPILSELEGEVAWAGLDLASTIDIAAFVVVIRQDDNYDVLPYFFVPEERVKERAGVDHVDYEAWIQQGFIEATPGNVIDYRYIRKRINEVGQQFNIREIAFDRWGATEIMQSLDDDGFTVVQFGQGFESMAHPTKELLRLVLDKKIRHGGHPVLRWMADNMTVKQDPAGNVKPDKSKSSEKIDGVVALIMALDRALRAEGASVYDERGILTL